jgi:DNA replication protein DnaC
MPEKINTLICECSNSLFEKIRKEIHEQYVKIIVKCLYCSKKSELKILYTSFEQQKEQQAERKKEEIVSV